MNSMTRRDCLQQIAALGVAAGAARTAVEAQTVTDTTRFFPGFKNFRVKTSGAEINGVIGGQGPPILFLHGAPQSHISWRLVAPKLAATRTVVVPDLRGYGDSSKPPDGENHSNYSKRAMALDQVEVMRSFGFSKFPVIGHDRGGRVTHRMALDHADAVTHAAVLDIVPTHYLYTHFKIEFVQRYFHWFNYLRPAPGPENDLRAQNEAARARATSEVQIEYLRTASDPANIHAMCEDYRAGASIDLAHDEADMSKKIACPLLVLWGQKGAMDGLYDVLGIWRERATKAFGKSLPAGHNLQEDVPDLVFNEIQQLLKM
jgi:haloacetate dehalogenase